MLRPDMESPNEAAENSVAPPASEAAVSVVPVAREPERWLPAAGPRVPSTWVLREQRLTGQLLLALTLVGIVTWGAGKLAYNEHPAEGQRYTPAELNVLANRPKDAAMEFHHSLCVLDFERAAQLALPSAQSLVEERRAACDDDCKASRTDRESTTFTRARLIEAKGRDARADVECHSKGAIDKASYTVRLEGPMWRVVERLPGT